MTPTPTIGVLCEPPRSGGWIRTRVRSAPSGVPVARCWDAVGALTVERYPRGVVVLDPVLP